MKNSTSIWFIPKMQERNKCVVKISIKSQQKFWVIRDKKIMYNSIGFLRTEQFNICSRIVDGKMIKSNIRLKRNRQTGAGVCRRWENCPRKCLQYRSYILFACIIVFVHFENWNVRIGKHLKSNKQQRINNEI